jgi:hypothetical protein
VYPDAVKPIIVWLWHLDFTVESLCEMCFCGELFDEYPVAKQSVTRRLKIL